MHSLCIKGSFRHRYAVIYQSAIRATLDPFQVIRKPSFNYPFPLQTSLTTNMRFLVAGTLLLSALVTVSVAIPLVGNNKGTALEFRPYSGTVSNQMFRFAH
jgi:hypothetical protein